MKPLILMLALVAGSLPSSMAHASSSAAALDTVFIVVAQDGTGDATTIQGGLALWTTGPTVVRVMPGVYDEVVWLGPPPATPAETDEAVRSMATSLNSVQALNYELILTAPGGPTVTRVTGFSPTGSTGNLISGFTIGQQVIHKVGLGFATRWENCIFEGGFIGECPGAPNLSGCEFRGHTRLNRYASHFVAFEDLRFRGAGLQLWARNEGDLGPLEFKRCVFEGPADTGVVAHPSGENHMLFEGCTFENLDYGVVAEAGCDDLIRVVQSRFFDIAQAAVFMDRAGQTYSPYCPTLSLCVAGSRFERCGQAVKWWPLIPVPGAARAIPSPEGGQATSVYGQAVSVVADTILDCTGTAIEMRVQWGGATLSGLIVSGAAGDGIALTNVSDRGMYGNVRVMNSEIRSNLGRGIALLEQTGDVSRQAPVQLTGNRVTHNGGHGIDVSAQDVQASLNVIHHNGGDGLRLHTPMAVQTSDVGLNTCVFNGGAGLLHTIEPGGDPGAVLLHHNITAQNDGAGISGDGVIRHNDSWMNPGGDFLGALIEDNLSVDPAFCDPFSEDFTLILGSVCAPDGPFGQIGALGIGCAPTATQLALVSAEVENGVVRLSWHDGSGRISEARIERSANGGPWSDVAAVRAGASGVIRFEEAVPGTGRFGYRLVSGGVALGDEAWVDVDLLILAVRMASPVRGGAIPLELSLPTLQVVRVELFDVAGRRVASQRWVPDSRRQRLTLGRSGSLVPGMYVVQVTQGDATRSERVILVR